MAEATKTLSHTHTLLHMTIGQLVDHDTDKTANTQTEMSKIDYLSKSSLLSVGKSGNRIFETHNTFFVDGNFVDIPCGSNGCNTTGPENTACFPIPVPEDDPNYTDKTCLKFVRTQEVMPLSCEQGMRTKEHDFCLFNFNRHVYCMIFTLHKSFV